MFWAWEFEIRQGRSPVRPSGESLSLGTLRGGWVVRSADGVASQPDVKKEWIGCQLY